MKKIFLTLSLSVLTILAFASKPHIVDVQINTEESRVQWIGSKVTESHEGTVNILKGSLAVNHGKLAGGIVVIDMNSITCTDLEPDAGGDKLVKHLKNEDFFNTKEFPTAEIKITRVDKGSTEGAYKVLANLTIKGITRPVSFAANIKFDNLKFSAEANIKIDRTKWNVRYGSGTFFENLGDRMIKDEIEFNVYLLSDE